MMRIGIKMAFEPRDLRVGVYWTSKPVRRVVLYVCIVPMLSIVITIQRKVPDLETVFREFREAVGPQAVEEWAEIIEEDREAQRR